MPHAELQECKFMFAAPMPCWLCRGAPALWLDTWSLAEIKSCASLKNDRQDFVVEADRVSERFRLFGGIPRFVLEQADASVEDAVQKFQPGDEKDLLSVRSFGSRTSTSHRLLHARVRYVRLRQSDRRQLLGFVLGCIRGGQVISRRR